MSTQVTYWRRNTIKLIARLRLIGHTYKQIADILDMSEDAIRMMHTRWGKIYLG